jgi:hypothetical protein
MDEQTYFEQFTGDEQVFDIGAIMERFIVVLKQIMEQYERDATEPPAT